MVWRLTQVVAGDLEVVNGEPESVAAYVRVRTSFQYFGVDPVVGRTFQAGEDKPGGPKVTVLTYGLWQRSLVATPELSDAR
jgi:hypothetical protein